MDPKCVGNVAKQSTAAATDAYKPETFARRGIFPEGDNFTCLVCNKLFNRLETIPRHMIKRMHCSRLEQIHASYTNVGGNFTCKLCKNHLSTDWKVILRHFNEKNHLEWLNNKRIEAKNRNSQTVDSCFPYITLMRNQIIEQQPEIFFCCCCKERVVGKNMILQHIGQKKHEELQKTSHTQMYVGKCNEKRSMELVKHSVSHVAFSQFYCNLCNCSLDSIESCLPHMCGGEHIKNIIISENTSNQSLTKNVETNENPQNSPRKFSQKEISESFAKLMIDNSITGPSRSDRYNCKVCRCILCGTKNVSAHVSGSQHRNLMQNGSNKLKSATESEETSDGSSSSWVSTENSSESWETYEGESQSYDSYENSSYSWESSDNVSDSWETISIQDLSSERQESTLFPIPSALVPLIPKNFLQHGKKEIFCALCDAHLRSPQSLIDHTQSKYHVAELNRYKVQAAKENKKQSAISNKSSTSNSPINARNKKPMQSVTKYETSNVTHKDIATQAGGRQPTLFELPKHLIPLISKHLLQHQEKGIFCVACPARLQSPQSLVDHTKSKWHLMRLNSYKAKIVQKRKEVVDTSGRNSTSSSSSNTISKKKLSVSINTRHVSSSNIQEAVTKESQPSQSNLFEIPDNLIPVLTKHCLRRFEHEIFCPACQVHLRHASNVIQHTASKYHVAALIKYKAAISSRGKSPATVSTTNIAVKSPINTVNEKPSNIKSQNNGTTLKSNTTNPQNLNSGLMEIPKKLLPLIAVHSLKHLKNEIYCPACQCHIKYATSLVSHTNSPRHAARLESFRASTSTKIKNTETQTSKEKNLQLSMAEAHRELQLIKETLVTKIEPQLRKITGESETVTGLENSLNKLAIQEVKAGTSERSPLNQMKNSTNRMPKYMKSRRQDTRLKKSRAFDPKFLKVDMQYIYEVNSGKLRIMKLSCRLCFPKTSSTVYCLICERSVAKKSQTFYEHICSAAHTVCLAEAEKNHTHFINYPDQFSDLTLAKEFMQETQEATIQCFACETSLKNDDAVILEHIEEDSHKRRKQDWNDGMEKMLQDILVEMESTWYNIQKYWCQPCDTEFNTEFHFAEHMESKRHKNCLKKMGEFQNRLVYDSCMACATLWLGVSEIYWQHCEEPMHKYLVQSGDFSVFKLPNEAKRLLENAEAEVSYLIELSNEVLTIQKVKADALLKCLEDSVKPVFPNAKAYPFGSRVSGLGFPNSDIDVFLDCGTYDGNKNTKEYQVELITSVERCLYNNQQSWEIEETLATTRTPIIKLRHRDTELSCDVSFKNGLSVENTKLLKCFIDNYPLCRKLMLFIKKWLLFCNLSGSHYITNYATCWYVIFYLQSKSILPSVASMIAKENKSNIIDGWETGISVTFDVCEKEFTFTELLRGFFVFYTKFDHRDSVACPIIGKTIKKLDFTELDLLPKEMAPYINHVTTKSVDGLVELFRIDSEMCIQDPYDLSHNLTKAVRKFTLNRFKRLCAISADVLNNFT